jgi:hypothetical protein
MVMTLKADMNAVERQFRDLPMEARRLTGPLFWLHGTETPEQLETTLQKVVEGGNGMFVAESRPAQRLARRGLVSAIWRYACRSRASMICR